MDILSAIATASDKDKMHIGMVEQETYEFASCESCSFYNTGSDHSDINI